MFNIKNQFLVFEKDYIYILRLDEQLVLMTFFVKFEFKDTLFSKISSFQKVFLNSNLAKSVINTP